MKMLIREGKIKDLKDYGDLLQRTYQKAYTNDKLGLTKDCFSKEIFSTKRVQDYLKPHLVNNNKQKTWVVMIDSKMIGSVTCINKNKKEAELAGFYVDSKYQGKGIGKKLYKLALKFAGKRDLVLDIYAHNKKTIKMYKKWGWKLDKSKGDGGFFYRHWPEWPKDLKARCMYMKLKRT